MSLDTKGQPQTELASSGALGDAFYPAFQWLFDEEGEFVDSVEDKLAQARMADNVEMFLARALAVGIIAGVALWIVGSLLGFLAVNIIFAGNEAPTFIGISIENARLLRLIDALKLPFIILVTGVVFGAIGFAVGF